MNTNLNTMSAKELAKYAADKGIALPKSMLKGSKAKIVAFIEKNAPKSEKRVGKRGRKPLAEVLTPAEMNKEIEELKERLASCNDQDEKKSIRRALRRRGHKGGLNIETSTKKQAANKTK